jgi:hypothetical protein
LKNKAVQSIISLVNASFRSFEILLITFHHI